MNNILIVDDNPVLLDIYSEILRKEGYSVSVAESGDDALDILRDRNFGIILLDIMMEPMNGWEILRSIRKFKDSDEAEIIILTAKALHPDEVLIYGDMIQGFLMKPVHIDLLRDYLIMIISERERRDDMISGSAKSNFSAGDISEYETLNQQIRVWEELLFILEDTYGVEKIAENREFREKTEQIRDIIADKKYNARVLESSLGLRD
ncbi:response regulator [Methanoplanus limicola]|uniref:Response regulator receiver protein n=1 Tax=Methanoplanus limicola DSM 2279 TaxID=937775 RepID=H1YZK6_9EURY|nr:response regulator [Methanoplanus limicola]EHQ36115.1 response regulator receiver protein [Methanoplanus limicola DSM 2279]